VKTIVFLGTNKSCSSYEAIKAADDMKYYTVLLTNRKSILEKRMDFPHAHRIIHCNLGDMDKIREVIRSLSESHLDICAIVSFIEPYCHTAAVLSREFGLFAFSEKAIDTMLCKIKSRRALDGSPYSPFYRILNNGKSLDRELESELPLVLKSPLSCASRDVHLVWTYPQFEEACGQLRGSHPDMPILAEKYLDGPQYLVETLTADGKTDIAAIVRQEITFAGRFIVTGYQMVLDDGGELTRSLREAAAAIVQLHGLQVGPCHLELRRAGEQWKLIEINPRIAGGAMNSFIETGYGFNLARETLRFALGAAPHIEYAHRKETFLQYVVVPEAGELIKITGKSTAHSSPGVAQVFLRPKKGSILIPPISMGNRYAYVIATGDTAQEARQNAKAGASEIKFHIRAIDTEDYEFSEAERSALDEMNADSANLKALEDFAGNIVFVRDDEDTAREDVQ